VVLHAAAQATAKDLIIHCRDHLADFKVPRAIYITDKLPRTATGKIQRRHVAAAFVPSP
jgi:fatty-acyl-CoA synthase